jgi:hypothetical protein
MHRPEQFPVKSSTIGEIGWGGMDWIGLAQDRDKWRALVNAVMNFGFNKMLGCSQVAAQLVAAV